MAEQSACASVVAAARADEEAARRGSVPATGSGSSTLVSHEETERGADGSSVHRTIQQGESLLLPLLVEQLRSSLRGGDSPAHHHHPHARALAPPHGPGPGAPASAVASAAADDSGTESGDDLRLLAAGLRDSIELQRHQQAQLRRGPAPTAPAAAAQPAPSGGLLSEVNAALARLQASLRQGGELGEVALDAERRDALLLLVARLQASLSLPPAPPAPAPAAKASPELVECPPAHSRRFANRRQRASRHTVGVTREELADARRLLEEQAQLSAAASPTSAPAPAATPPAASAYAGLVASPVRQYSLLKQSSAGELHAGQQASGAGEGLTPAQRAFRPVRFTPGRSKSASQAKERASPPGRGPAPAPAPARNDPPSAADPPPPARPAPTASQPDSLARTPAPAPAPTKAPEPVGPKHHYTPQAFQGVANVPMAAVVGKEYRPKMGGDASRLRNKSLSQSSSVESSQSKSSVSDRSAGSEQFHQPLSHSSSCESTSNSKASTPQRSDSGNLSNQPLDGANSQNPFFKNPVGSFSTDNEARSQASSRSSSENHIPRAPEAGEPRSQNADASETSQKQFPAVFAETKHKPVSQTASLDNTGQATPMRPLVQKVPQPKSVVHSSSLDSTSSNYDPSVLLFTPSQAMQIAIHKAAINKQLSREEERRQSTSSSRHGSFSKTCESEGASSDGEEGGDEAEEEYLSYESGQSDSEEDAEEETTVRQMSNGNAPPLRQPFVPQQSSGNSQAKIPAHPERGQEMLRGTESMGASNINSVAKPFAGSVNNTGPAAQPVSNINNVNLVNSGYGVHQPNQTVPAYPKPNLPPNAQQENYENANSSTWTTDVAKHEFIYDQPRVESDSNMNSVDNTVYAPPSYHDASLHSNAITNIHHTTAYQNANAHDVSSLSNGTSNVSSAQRLLQMATADSKIPTRYRSDRKVKMKRANTIDIPKPLNFYEIEDESDYSSGEEYEDEEGDKQMNRNSSNSQHRAAYLALRGPIRVGSGNKYPGDNKVPPPNFQPKTESDRKFLAFLQQHGSNSSNQPAAPENVKVTSYNPSARGGHHWSNRFSNIKTAFESTANKEMNQVERGPKVAYGPAAARLFWQSADDSATVMKARPLAAANGPKLTKQGSQFLRKLFEQKDQEKQEQSKLPWAEKPAEENVVVGSLTVANTKNSHQNSIYNKKQVFTPPPSPISQPVKINKFSHAPMSAFRPVEKKSCQRLNEIPMNTAPAVNQPWASPSVSGNVKQLASQKFNPSQPPAPLVSANPDTSANISRTVKHRGSFSSQNGPQDVGSPVSPTLPWIKEGTDHRSLNSAVAKFENMSRETSPQPSLPSLAHSRSIEKIAVPQSLSLYKQPEVVAPKTYIPPSNGPGIVQGRLQENNIFPNVQSVKEPPNMPKPPSLLSPSLAVAQTFESKQVFSKNDYRKQQEILKNHQEKYSSKEKYSGQEPNAVNQYYQAHHNNSHQHTPNKTDPPSQQFDRSQVQNAAQTYSGSVTSRTAVYSNALPNAHLNNVSDKKSKSPISPLSLPLKNIPPNLESPDMPSPEAFTAVSHVMTGPVSHQAVTVSQKTRHRYDEEGEEHKSSAARNLSSVLQISMVKGDGKADKLGVPKQNKSPSPGPRQNEPAAANQKSGMVRNKSESDIKLMENPQFSEYQRDKDTDERPAARGYQANGLPLSTRLRPASAESLIMATSTEELQESGESVLTTRLQIPVYNNVSGKVPSHRSGSLHDIMQDRKSPYENGHASQSPLQNSHVLHKSGSWHQLAPGQQGKPRRPQSLAIPDLPTGNTGNARRAHGGLSKAKSSHSLAFPKQFEAALAPDTIENKKSKVEAYLKVNDPNVRSQSKSPNTTPQQKPSVPQKPEIPLLDDSLDNVEEAFEDLFNSTAGQSTKVNISSSKLKTKRINHSEQVHSIQHQHSAASTQFANRQGVWEEPGVNRASRVPNLPPHMLAHDFASK